MKLFFQKKLFFSLKSRICSPKTQFSPSSLKFNHFSKSDFPNRILSEFPDHFQPTEFEKIAQLTILNFLAVVPLPQMKIAIPDISDMPARSSDIHPMPVQSSSSLLAGRKEPKPRPKRR
jgi:hypothetical protein